MTGVPRPVVSGVFGETTRLKMACRHDPERLTLFPEDASGDGLLCEPTFRNLPITNSQFMFFSLSPKKVHQRHTKVVFLHTKQSKPAYMFIIGLCCFCSLEPMFFGEAIDKLDSPFPFEPKNPGDLGSRGDNDGDTARP